MFGFIKNLLRKQGDTSASEASHPSVEAVQAVAPPPPPRPQPPPAAARSAYNHRNGNAQNGGNAPARGLELSLQSILAVLPLELQPRIRQQEVGDAAILVPLEKILSQLPRGSVKIAFGEVRQAFPGVFSHDSDRDTVAVPLPLGEILSRLNPALITRRRAQKQVHVPPEISSPFDPKNEGLIFSVGPAKPEPAPASHSSHATFAARHTAAPHATPVTPVAHPRSTLTSAPTPPPPSAIPTSPPPAVLPAGRPLQLMSNHVSPAPQHPAPQHPAPQPPAPPLVPMAPISSISPLSALNPPNPLAPSPLTASEPEVRQHVDPNPLIVSMTALAESWPEAVRKEVVQLKLVEAKVALPSDVVENALRQGRIAFSWKTLRSWVRPNPGSVPSPLDSTVVELPLKVVAPLFLARQRAASQGQQRVAVDAEIPNLFFGFPQPESNGRSAAPGPEVATASTAKPVDTNYYVWEDSTEEVHVREATPAPAPHKASPGTKLVARCATPNEVVARAAALDGVAGALVALPDGLMVANKISSDLNGDTLAAFLPQIFSKMSQCTKELRMGDLNNLHFTVGNVPWKVFRVNAIFFAAFGRVGEPLPTAQLAALAAELDHKNK
jgi:predicted regulator of Ras-like GTPase activity (Roadblock/LC7/MglB family)